jgi:uncharacterized protein (TIRG00374 family)
MNETPKRKFWRSPYVRFGGSGLVLLLLLTYLPYKKVFSTIKSIPAETLLALLFGYLLLHLLGVIKWRVLINLAGADLEFPQAVRCYYWGLFGNIFLPSLVGGDVVRGGMAFLFSRSRAAIVLGSLMDRVQDVAGLLAVTCIGVLLLPGSLDDRSHRKLWLIAVVLMAAGLVAVASLFLIPARKFPMKARRIMVKLRRGIRSMYRKPGRMFTCFLIGMALQVSQVAINYYLGELAGLHMGFAIWLFAWPLAKLSALVPVTQGGIGVREVALVSLMAPFGAPAVLTAAVGLTFQAIVITGGLIGGILALAMGRFSSSAGKARIALAPARQAKTVTSE